MDETYVRVARQWTYLYRAIDSAGNKIEFLLSPNRDLIAAKGFPQLALAAANVQPRVISVDGHAADASAHQRVPKMPVIRAAAEPAARLHI